MAAEELSKGDSVCFFKCEVGFGAWESAFVRAYRSHVVVISQRQDNAGKPIRAAYEDV